MPRCTICSHSDTRAIERAIIQGEANTVIAARYDLDHQAVRRHALNHLPKSMVKADQIQKKMHARSVHEDINDLIKDNKRIRKEAIKDGQKNMQIKANKELRSLQELRAKVAVQLEKFKREDQRNTQQNKVIGAGLEALSDEELNCLNYLMAKAISGDNNMILDHESQMLVEWVNSDRSDYPATHDSFPGDTDSRDMSQSRGRATDKVTSRSRGKGCAASSNSSKGVASSRQSDSPSSKTSRNDERRAKSPENTPPDTIDDLDIDLDDLTLEDLEESNEIPSEDTDPEWFAEEVKRRRRDW